MICPDFEALLVALHDPSSHTDVVDHMEGGCPRCDRRRRLITGLLETLGHGRLPAPREEWSRAASNLVRESPTPDPPRHLGEPAVASGPQPALRGAALCHRHLRYTAGPFEVDLALLSPSTLVGTVVPDESGVPDLGGAVCVLSGSGSPRQVQLERNGDFRFEGVDPGRYLVLVDAPGVDLVIEDVDLGSSEWGHR